jgi:hypothetical protein
MYAVGSGKQPGETVIELHRCVERTGDDLRPNLCWNSHHSSDRTVHGSPGSACARGAALAGFGRWSVAFALIALKVILTSVIAFISFHFYEKRFLRLKGRFHGKQR